MKQIRKIEQAIEPLRRQLTEHQLYQLLSDIEDIRIFMESHVYAVWDFMSLLKALQHHLTCITIPWKPVKNAKTARFINEIVFGEETDLNALGVPKSHFEMYLAAMEEVNANTKKVSNLMNEIDSLETINEVLSKANLQEAERNFLTFTFDIIKTGEIHKIAAAFTFGREDLIPDMFIEIIKQSNTSTNNRFTQLTYYLERHIELDGDEHGPLSLEMIQELCGNDEQKWSEVLEVAQFALIQRINLWNSIAEELKVRQATMQLEHTY